MKASVGDRLVIRGHRIHEPDRDAEILEVRGPHGEPPYKIRWSDTGRETLFYPGIDAKIEHLPHRPPRSIPATEVAGRRARDDAAKPRLTQEEAIALVRRHVDLEKLRTADYDTELWALWQEEVERAGAKDTDADILDRVLERVRAGE